MPRRSQSRMGDEKNIFVSEGLSKKKPSSATTDQ